MSSAFSDGFQRLFTQFENSLNSSTLFAQASSKAAALIGTPADPGVALKLFVLLYLITFLLNWIKYLANAGVENNAFASLIETGLFFGFFLFLFTNYGEVFGSALPSLFTAVATALGSTVPAGSGQAATTAYTSTVSILGDAMDKLWGGIGRNWSGVDLNPLPPSNPANGPLMMGIVFQSLAMIAVLFALMAFLLVTVLGDILASVAIVLGPFFIALSGLEFTRRMFFGWIEFLMGALAIKIVAAALGIVAGLIATGMSESMRTLGGGYVSELSAFLMFGYSAAIAYVMVQAPDIAGSLTSSRLVGGSGFVSASQRMASQMGRGVVQGTRSTASSLANKWKGDDAKADLQLAQRSAAGHMKDAQAADVASGKFVSARNSFDPPPDDGPGPPPGGGPGPGSGPGSGPTTPPGPTQPPKPTTPPAPVGLFNASISKK